MSLTKDQKEKLVMAVQAVLGALFIGLSIKNSAKTQSDQMKKVLAKNAKQAGKLYKLEYKLQKRELKRKYRHTGTVKKESWFARHIR